MKKLIFLAISQLLFCSIAFGQTDNPGCYFLSTVTDAACESDTSCSSADHCTTAQFTVQCAGLIRAKAYTKSADGTPCAHCASCVTISTTGGLTLLSFDTSAECDESGGGICCDSASVRLSPGNYNLRVCLIPCNGIDYTPCCNEGHNFKAWGVVSSDPLSCQ